MTTTLIDIVTPTECPSCNGAVKQEGNSGQIRCTNVYGCPAQIKGRLVKWVGRDAADIDAIGPTWIDKFVDGKLIGDPSSFYFIHLSEGYLRRFEGMGDRNVEKFLKSIEGSKNLGMRRALIGFCIPNASEGTAKRLCKHYDSVEAVMKASRDELELIEDIGPTVADSIHRFFGHQYGQTVVENLREAGVNLDRLPEDKPVGAGAPLSGMTFVITGKLSVGRKEFAAELEAAGAKVSGSVSANTTALITDEPDSATGKSKKARDLGVKTMTETDVRGMM